MNFAHFGLVFASQGQFFFDLKQSLVIGVTTVWKVRRKQSGFVYVV